MAAAGPGDWYNGLPPVTRALGTSMVLSAAGLQLGLLSPGTFVMSWDRVVGHLEVWRCLSTFVFIGGFSFNFLMQLLMLHNYGISLENSTFLNRQADYLWMLLFGAAAFLLTSLVANLHFYASPLIFMLCYVWSRHNPEAQVSIMGFFRVSGFYLPWAWCAMGVIMGGSPFPDLMGILVGHLYYFSTVLYPRRTGKDPLRTPGFVHTLAGYAGFAPMPRAAGQAAPRAGGGFRGRGQRLGGD